MKFYISGILIFLLCMGSVFHANAQRENPIRIELNANLDMENYNLVPCGENGILVFYEDVEKGSEPDTRVWHFAFYDRNFQQKPENNYTSKTMA